METTARERFIEDYTLVVDNDQEAYNEVKETVAKYSNKEYSTGEIAIALQNQFEAMVSEVAYNATESHSEVAGNLISQMLQGWGTDTWYKIATHYVQMFNEEN